MLASTLSILLATLPLPSAACSPDDVSGIYFTGGATTLRLFSHGFEWTSHGKYERRERGALKRLHGALQFEAPRGLLTASYAAVDGELWLGVFARRRDGVQWSSSAAPDPMGRQLLPKWTPITAELTPDLRTLSVEGVGVFHATPIFHPSDPNAFFLLFAPLSSDLPGRLPGGRAGTGFEGQSFLLTDFGVFWQAGPDLSLRADQVLWLFEALGHRADGQRGQTFRRVGDAILTPWSVRLGPIGVEPWPDANPTGASWRRADGGEALEIADAKGSDESHLRHLAHPREPVPLFRKHPWRPDALGFSHQEVLYDCMMNHGDYPSHHFVVATGPSSLVTATVFGGCHHQWPVKVERLTRQ